MRNPAAAAAALVLALGACDRESPAELVAEEQAETIEERADTLEDRGIIGDAMEEQLESHAEALEEAAEDGSGAPSLEDAAP